MDTKPIKPKLEPHETDDAWVDTWIARNREQINRDLAGARASLAADKGKRYTAGSNEFVNDAMARLGRRSPRKLSKR